LGLAHRLKLLGEQRQPLEVGGDAAEHAPGCLHAAVPPVEGASTSCATAFIASSAPLPGKSSRQRSAISLRESSSSITSSRRTRLASLKGFTHSPTPTDS